MLGMSVAKSPYIMPICLPGFGTCRIAFCQESLNRHFAASTRDFSRISACTTPPVLMESLLEFETERPIVPQTRFPARGGGLTPTKLCQKVAAGVAFGRQSNEKATQASEGCSPRSHMTSRSSGEDELASIHSRPAGNRVAEAIETEEMSANVPKTRESGGLHRRLHNLNFGRNNEQEADVREADSTTGLAACVAWPTETLILDETDTIKMADQPLKDATLGRPRAMVEEEVADVYTNCEAATDIAHQASGCEARSDLLSEPQKRLRRIFLVRTISVPASMSTNDEEKVPKEVGFKAV
ncbi:unnamed protein product [Protopolystoma xenopodis]|uniref:Uncharacterized protein n=1 Tax=Protopolystoma xenopodis TaxID=117903 RepID=A0A448WNE9_9PLAT|nr:unnamed protein product [Protopolystoma xenopodis]